MDLQFIFQHIKSHQDNNADLASLTLESQLNVKADKLATAFMVEDKTRQPIATLSPLAISIGTSTTHHQRCIYYKKDTSSHPLCRRQSRNTKISNEMQHLV
jgi:hypothetical protein